MRVGIGYDSHRFDPTRRLILGGVEIPGGQGLAGHSDADALTHALTDAILGAAALGDIGSHFPDTDPRWKNANSLLILETAHGRARGAGYQIVNADITVVLEQPRIAPYARNMQLKLSSILACAPEALSIKAKTNEGLGFIGRGEGIAVMAVVLLDGPAA